MSAREALHPLIEAVTCSLCGELFNQPSTFSSTCGHTFCQECVIDRLEGPGIIKSECPTCKQPGWKKDLSNNHLVQNVVECLKSLLETYKEVLVHSKKATQEAQEQPQQQQQVHAQELISVEERLARLQQEVALLEAALHLCDDLPCLGGHSPAVRASTATPPVSAPCSPETGCGPLPSLQQPLPSHSPLGEEAKGAGEGDNGESQQDKENDDYVQEQQAASPNAKKKMMMREREKSVELLEAPASKRPKQDVTDKHTMNENPSDGEGIKQQHAVIDTQAAAQLLTRMWGAQEEEERAEEGSGFVGFMPASQYMREQEQEEPKESRLEEKPEHETYIQAYRPAPPPPAAGPTTTAATTNKSLPSNRAAGGNGMRQQPQHKSQGGNRSTPSLDTLFKAAGKQSRSATRRGPIYLTISGTNIEVQGKALQLAQLIADCTVEDDVTRSTTHVLVATTGDGLAERRSVKYLTGIARGCWVLSLAWIDACLAAKAWIPEKEYEVKGVVMPPRPGTIGALLDGRLAAAKSRRRAEAGQPGLFQGTRFLVTTFKKANATRIRDLVIQVVEAAGGVLVKSVTASASAQGVYVLADDQGVGAGYLEQVGQGGGAVVAPGWVLDSVTCCKVLPKEYYTFV